MSDEEQKTITDCIHKIQQEILERIDNHSQRVIVSGLELLLNYCQRFYERQFNTRSAQNKDVVSTLDALLKEYCEQGHFSTLGVPAVQYFADKVHLSPHYLSDLLKKEIGLGIKEYINEFIVDKAKTLLLGTTNSVSEIAFTLGFNYPHYFSRLFRSKTGISPKDYRLVN
ncbi:helix-turn-helix domain-containing protein [Mucilaginibacter sp. UC70_90]